MLDSHKRLRLGELRSRVSQLTPDEQSELEALALELEATESAYLRDATERLRLEREHVEHRNQALQALAIRRQGLAQRLESALADASNERRAIEAELGQIKVGSSGIRVGNFGPLTL